MGKDKTTILTLFMVMCVTFIGCDQDNETSNQYGTFSLHIEASNNLIEMGSSSTRTAKGSICDSLQTSHATTRATDDIPEAGDFELYLYSNNLPVGRWDNFNDFDSETKYPIGKYTLEARYGNVDEEGFMRPCFIGSENIEIRSLENTPLNSLAIWQIQNSRSIAQTQF